MGGCGINAPYINICRMSMNRGFAAETSVELLDGRLIPFSEIKPFLLRKEKLWTLAVDPFNQICASQIIDAQTIGASTKAIEILMDYGSSVICGHEQKFFLRDFTERRAVDLGIGDALLRASVTGAGLDRSVFQPSAGEYQKIQYPGDADRKPSNSVWTAFRNILGIEEQRIAGPSDFTPHYKKTTGLAGRMSQSFSEQLSRRKLEKHKQDYIALGNELFKEEVLLHQSADHDIADYARQKHQVTSIREIERSFQMISIFLRPHHSYLLSSGLFAVC